MSYEIATCSRLNFAGSAAREVTVPSVEVSSAALFLATSQHAPCDPLDQAEGKGHVHGLEEQPSEEATGGSLHGGGCTVVLSSRCSPHAHATNYHQRDRRDAGRANYALTGERDAQLWWQSLWCSNRFGRQLRRYKIRDANQFGAIACTIREAWRTLPRQVIDGAAFLLIPITCAGKV